MFDKLKAGLSVFRYGQEVANPAAWKAGQITGTVVGALLLAIVNLAQAFGHPFPIDADTANTIGAGIVAVANVLLTAATSKRAGILPAADTEPNGPSDSQISSGMPNANIDSATREKAMQSVSNANDPLAGLDTTYAGP